MKHKAAILKIERAMRMAESEMIDLIAVTRGEYKRKPWEDIVIGTYKIYGVKIWLRRIRLGVRALKKDL